MIKKSPFLPGGDKQVVLRVETEQYDTDEGTVTRRTGVALVPFQEDPFKAYSFTRELEEFVGQFPDHRFTGGFEGEGEQNTDMWRLKVVDGKVVEFAPEIVWPEGSEI